MSKEALRATVDVVRRALVKADQLVFAFEFDVTRRAVKGAVKIGEWGTRIHT
jgi:hypothetical protein